VKKDLNIKQKSPDEQKRIIRTYVQKVIVFPEHIDIKFVVDTTNGAESPLIVSTYKYLRKCNTMDFELVKRTVLVNSVF